MRIVGSGTMACDVFVLHATSDSRMADRVGATLRNAGFEAFVGRWDRAKPPKCRAVVVIATRDIAEIEGAIGSALWQQLPIFALRLEPFQAQGNLRGFLRAPTLSWIEGAAHSLDDSLVELTRALSVRL